MKRIALVSMGAVSLLLVAAAPATVLTTAQPGLWEIERAGTPLKRSCVAQVAALAQLEHQRKSCTRVVIRDTAALATVHYTCPGGGFGESAMRLVTPRSLRVQTQGISDGAPFNYVFQARRVGDCPAH
ncbi:hypothetical protein H8M03_00300 [Sphingomonas sabuli]|uniref:DUF3617 family protein n=1 Tax=Sphingomonas sabuli TaxID=2764186 RepID=A0A7G9L2K4_9SPHN|nr:DUF3617 family protein [Sphingomonas sabuli]QNM82853.1 hypothetical protein H8M03_00300 [Sphingomonas sabuli]